jgi:hypothetical protein
MIRPFDWRDVSLVKQLSDQGICLDSVTRLTRGTQPLQNALLAYLMPGTGAPTLIWKDNGRAAFGQLRHRPGEEQARALFIAPAWSEEADGWLPLVEQLAVEAGGRGGHNLLAEVDEISREFEALRMAGFAIYARQSAWKLAGEISAGAPALSLRAAVSADSISISTLYSNVVPRLIQQVEPPPRPGHGYVLQREDELIAFLDVRRGPLGIWMEPHVHPEADALSAEMLNAALWMLANSNRAGRPVYVCVRRYQDWWQDILQGAGFECLGSQAVMVKRLAVRVAEPVLKPLPALEGNPVTTTTPMIRSQIEMFKN